MNVSCVKRAVECLRGLHVGWLERLNLLLLSYAAFLQTRQAEVAAARTEGRRVEEPLG